MNRNLTIKAVFNNNRSIERTVESNNGVIKFSQLVECKRDLIADVGDLAIRKFVLTVTITAPTTDKMYRKTKSVSDVTLKVLRGMYSAMK